MSADKPAPANRSLEQWMGAHHHLLANLFVVVACIFGGLAGWQFIRAVREESYLFPAAMWTFFQAMVFLFAGLYLKLSEPASFTGDETRYRLLALGVGGVAGFLTFLLGVWLPLNNWATSFVPPLAKAGKETIPLLQHWRENWGRIMLCALAVIGGLALMFASLQLARRVERVNGSMRRLLYGYNAVLTGLLLLASLGLLNVLSYVQLPPFTLLGQQIDYTRSQMYTLSDKSVNLLTKGLKGSINVYALLSPRYTIATDIRTLCENCKRYKRDFEYGFYSPDANPEYRTLKTKYGKLLNNEELGLIVVYRDENGKEEAAGLRLDDLFSDQSDQRDPNAAPRLMNKAENALMKTMSKLADSKPARIVFVKGHGELELQPSQIAGERGQDLSRLKKRLEETRNYEFKEVTLGAEDNSGLADADIVVVPGPTRGYPEKAIQALREYLNPRGSQKKGKMIVLLGKQARGDEMLKTGLEGLLRENGVEISDKRILSATDQPDLTIVMPALRSSNEIARAFSTGRSVMIWRMREPRRLSAFRGEMPTTKVEPLLVTLPDISVWEEANVTAPPADLLQRYMKPGTPKEQMPKFEEMLTTAVTVSDSRPRAGMPMDQRHMGITEDVPRMVVFGDSWWLTSEVGLRDRGTGADLFDSCIGWLRGKADIGRGENYAAEKARPEYSLADKGLTSDRLSRVVWLPLLLVFIAIVALGGGIWVVRRR
jgi:hypothetical protein